MRRIWIWLFLAILFRMAAAFTHQGWHHPDEWFQTLELGNLLANGVGSNTQEISLHLRNLTLPSFLSIPLLLAGWLDPSNLWFRIFLVQAMVAIFSLGAIWGFYALLRDHVQRGYKNARFIPREEAGWVIFGMVVFSLSYFSLPDAIRPSAENFSFYFFMLSLGFLLRGRLFLSGFLAVGIFAMRYPSGLLSLGLALGVLFSDRLKGEKGRKAKWLFFYGMAAAVPVFGAADWFFYGRPWESLWMYLQYNVFTGLSAQNFGTQTVAVYGQYLVGHWFRFLFPLGAVLAVASIWGFWAQIRKRSPEAIAFFVYLLGHVLVPHKEPRFMVPIEYLWAWLGWVGLYDHRRYYEWILRMKWAKATIVFFLVLNCGLLVGNLRGQMLQSVGTYFELPFHLKKRQVCGVVTVRKPISTTLLGRSHAMPAPALAFFPADKKLDSFSEVGSKPLIWIQKAPSCSGKDRALLHVHRTSEEWDRRGCVLLRSGLLSFLPKDFWKPVIKRNWIRGPWYDCPSSILSVFAHSETRAVLAHGFERLSSLPPLGVEPEKLLELSRANGLGDGTIGDW